MPEPLTGQGTIIRMIDAMDNRLTGMEEQLTLSCTRLQDLHQWHNVRDPGGTFVWYVRSSLEQSIARLADSLDQSTRVLEKLVVYVADIKTITDDTRTRVMSIGVHDTVDRGGKT